ncbi:hypothetical protein evm_001483 [Chilo suppressalis]|nr:hypothetical protein evm_001483 [Chilo suppressalis]
MANKLDLQLVVKHIANGTLAENLCRVCLSPLRDPYENIFSKICTENEEYCIANILKELYDMQFSDDEHFNICSDCLAFTLNAYKFYLKAKHNELLLHLYTDNLIYHLDAIDIPANISNESIFISLPILTPDIPSIEFDPSKKFSVKKFAQEDKKKVNMKKEQNMEKPPIIDIKKTETNFIKPQVKIEQEDDDDLIIIMNEKGLPTFYKMQTDGQLVEVEYDDRCRKAYKVITEQMPKKRVHKKKRGPMTWKKCSKCPIEYRFVAKLKEHMWLEHETLLYSCKICEALAEDEDEYQFHMKTHTNEYQCDLCEIVFKKRETIIAHLELHEKSDESKQNKNNYVCKICGKIMKDAESLNIHTAEHNLKEYTCYYCGRMYKKEIGFNKHIKKHEMYMNLKEMRQKRSEQPEKQIPEPQPPKQNHSKVLTCEICGRIVLSERALIWHKRLHTNERPFTCKTCGRGFVSLNRCKQHALCAHTAPTRRCPLCPALFHMRSMVNSHIKKVHLKTHKRRNRAVRQQEVCWHTETVPIQELSVAIQGDILELQAAKTMSDNEMYAD